MKRIFLIPVLCITFLLILAACSYGNSNVGNTDNVTEDEAAITQTSGSYSSSIDEGRREYHGGGDWAPLSNIDSLAFNATDIFRAEVLDSRTERVLTWLYAPGETLCEERVERFTIIHTIHRLRVLEVFKGDAVIGEIVEVMQPGGRLGDDELIYNRLQHFSHGDELIFFTRNFIADGFGHLPMSLVSPGQSTYRIVPSNVRGMNEFADGIVTAYDANPELADFALECIGAWNDIVLTVGDLILIRFEAGLGPRPHNLQQPTGVDRSRMNETISIAKYHMSQNYNLPGWDNVQNLLEEAIRVRDNPYSRQIHVNPASSRLRRAMQELGINTNIPGSTPPPMDTNREYLHAAIIEAEHREQYNYPLDNWSNLQTALAEARFVHDNQYATQSQIDTATANLWAAINALEETSPAPDRAALAAAMEEAESLNADDYTEETWAHLLYELAIASQVVIDPSVTQEQLDYMTNRLQAAIDALLPADSGQPTVIVLPPIITRRNINFTQIIDLGDGVRRTWGLAYGSALLPAGLIVSHHGMITGRAVVQSPTVTIIIQGVDGEGNIVTVMVDLTVL